MRLTPALRRILTSAGTGALTFVISQLGDQDVSVSIMLTTVLGATVLIADFLVSFERKLSAHEGALDRHTREVEHLVDQGFARINKATALYSRLEDSKLDIDAIDRLVRGAAQIGGQPDIVHIFAQRVVGRVAGLMEGLQAGEAGYDGEDRDWILTLTDSATLSIDATSTAVDTNFWNSELGLSYLQSQREAISRRVKIRRVFILDNPTDAELEEARRVGRAQAALNVSVRVVATKDLPPSARLGPMMDFIVFDQAISYEVTPGLPSGLESQPMIASTRLVLRPDRVNRRMQRFNDLWNASEPVE
ncbi:MULTISPECIES: DUF6879 family protein [Kitasatospora]|uniref:DUF6879 domain-containing protein n=2 Tax=Kitasatospora TaxID=2063 RepID=A0ABT1IPW8_9ACTN|nr:hypothetical protein [Kitasatospora paracochleata]MCP2307175.1 hypothetical protein [Kitasatospora paracochleata]